MKLNFSKKNLLPSIVFAVSLLLIIIGIYYLVNDIITNSKELANQKKEMLTQRKNEENISKIRKEYEENFPDLLKIENLFVSADNPLPFIDFLEKNASSEGVSYKVSSTVLNTGKEGKYFVFNVSTISSYPQFFKFLVKIEKGPYLTQVYNLNLKRIGEEDIKKGDEFAGCQIGDVSSNFSLKVFTK